jgi:CobQ-like glutamine amidotransferase family enzyme
LPDSYENRRLRVAHLYPEVMDLYGDGGNVVTIRRRCEWRGIDAEVVDIRVGDRLDPHEFDLLFIGGGQDTGQRHIARDLLERGEAIREFVEAGGAVLAVCAGFQLFGNAYTTADGRELTGIGVFDAYTVASRQRIIGNCVVVTEPSSWQAFSTDEPITIAGFENHAGRTHLGPCSKPLARVVAGGGNLGDARGEGAVYGNAVGTYLHGPVLPKNPELADRLLLAALHHRYGAGPGLAPLDDEFERRAHDAAVARCLAAAGEVGLNARLAG